MLKKNVYVGFIVLLMFAIVSACSSTNSSESSDKTLTVVNWKDYGSDDPAVVKEFEDMYDVKVVHVYMASEQELLTKLRTDSKGLDVILPNASILPVAIENGLLAEIDTNKLENYKNIYEPFKSIPENTSEGKIYAVPWVWGSTAIAYNSELITEEIDSVQALWDEKYAGKIAFRDDFNDAIMTTALALGQDPNNPSDLEAIKQKLIEQKALNRTYWKSGDEFAKLFAGQQVSIGLMWSGQTASMKQEGQPIKYVIPQEGAIGWVDNWSIVEGTENMDLALKFIDFMIDRKFQENWVNNGGPAPVNKEASKTLDPAFIEEMGLDEKAIEKLHFISYHTDEVMKQWNEIWQEVKSE